MSKKTGLFLGAKNSVKSTCNVENFKLAIGNLQLAILISFTSNQ